MTYSTLWLLLIIAVSSAQTLDDIAKDDPYEEGNALPGPTYDQSQDPGAEDYWRSVELLYKQMRSSQLSDNRYQDEAPVQTWPGLSGIKEPGTKRWLNFFNSSASKNKNNPQRKWNFKKGKVPALCYLKLCSFPYYYNKMSN